MATERDVMRQDMIDRANRIKEIIKSLEISTPLQGDKWQASMVAHYKALLDGVEHMIKNLS